MTTRRLKPIFPTATQWSGVHPPLSPPNAFPQLTPRLSAALDRHKQGSTHAPAHLLQVCQASVAAPGQVPPPPCSQKGLLGNRRKTSDKSTFFFLPVATFILSNCQVIKGYTHTGPGSPLPNNSAQAFDTPGRQAPECFFSIVSGTVNPRTNWESVSSEQPQRTTGLTGTNSNTS